MIEEIDFEIYLSVSKKKYTIYLFDKKNFKNLYKENALIKYNSNFIDLKNLSKFLDDNIYKIEKLSGKFIKNIFLIIDSSLNSYVNIGIKKKNDIALINPKKLENSLIEVKDLFKENHQEQTIMHMIIDNYLINGKKYSFFVNSPGSDHLCLEVSIISISNHLIIEFDKILEKYQIKISQYLDEDYVNFFLMKVIWIYQKKLTN